MKYIHLFFYYTLDSLKNKIDCCIKCSFDYIPMKCASHNVSNDTCTTYVEINEKFIKLSFDEV